MTDKTLAPPPANPAGDRRIWGGLHGGAGSLAIAEAARAHSGLSLVIAESARQAAQLEAELRFFAGDLPVMHFPDWETLPYDVFSPHQDLVSERLRSLHLLPRTRQGLLVVPVTTLMQRLPPRAWVDAHSFVYRVGETLDMEALRRRLGEAGYRAVDTVYEHGEYAVRGSILDVYPMGSDLPLRIDLFDDEIESLRTFDPETQVSIEHRETFNLLPAREFPLDREGIKTFLDNWHESFDVDPRQCPVYEDVRNGRSAQGVEYYLPLFFSETATLFDYLPDATLVFTRGDLPDAAEHFWKDVRERYEEYGVDPRRPLLPPPQVFLTAGELFSRIGAYPRTDIRPEPAPDGGGHHNFDTAPPEDVSVDSRAARPLSRLRDVLLSSDHRTLFCAESAGRRDALLQMLADGDIRPRDAEGWRDFADGDQELAICVFPLEAGLRLEDPPLRLVTESMLFGQQVMQRRRRQRGRDNNEFLIRNLTELKPGAPVVHIDHGVGRYLGLQTLDVGDEAQEFLTLSYADDARLYVPVTNLHLISRYSGGDEALAPLHRLGNEQWQKARRKAAEQVRDTAAELLDIYARRAARKGFAADDPGGDYLRFSAEFPFEETPDQQEAIEAVRADMLASQPMDRLVCGDVGFGKTEVAMRATFIAVANNRQALMLVPTTLLAQQHFDNFRDRFSNWPVAVEVISRFRTARDQKKVLERFREGHIDILIGTHKLLQDRIEAKNLGLLIIDEEHRFGVHQKEKIKALRAEVDILTLTATPIPRTLNMAMGGIRDLSIIATPPARRLSVKTFVRQREDRVIREAVLRELLRGGQVFYLHNEVKSIDRAARELQELVPEARTGIAHGQMRERELEQVMSNFYHQRFNVLVCTTIIETGIDIPSANTVIIERADRFGLAQLHQLRGRVGRSHHQAYAYLLTPHPRAMTGDAGKRLEALAEADHLGSGFTLATNDLEIRGAGELLGEDQSGHIHSVGFSLYMSMLEEAVEAIREGRTPDAEAPLKSATEISLQIPALIPEDYLPDINTRLILYKRLANTASEEELRELQVEMIDRFGLLPDPTRNLIQLTRLRQRAETLGITRLDAGPRGARITFSSDTPVEPLAIVELVQRDPERYQLSGASELRLTADMESTRERLETIDQLLDTLIPSKAAANAS